MAGSIGTGTWGYNMEGWGAEQPKELRPLLRLVCHSGLQGRPARPLVLGRQDTQARM